MIFNFKKILIILLGLFVGCSREVDISEFSDDFRGYESELRIEALISPQDNNAIVRIDKSILIDDTVVYDCRDNDFGEIWDLILAPFLR